MSRASSKRSCNLLSVAQVVLDVHKQAAKPGKPLKRYLYPRANSQAPFQLSAFFTGRDKVFSDQPKKRGAPFFPGPDQQRLRFLAITNLLSQTERRWSVEIWNVEWRPKRSITAQPTPESRWQKCLRPFRVDLPVPFRRNAHWSNGGVARVGFSTRR